MQTKKNILLREKINSSVLLACILKGKQGEKCSFFPTTYRFLNIYLLKSTRKNQVCPFQAEIAAAVVNIRALHNSGIFGN